MSALCSRLPALLVVEVLVLRGSCCRLRSDSPRPWRRRAARGAGTGVALGRRLAGGVGRRRRRRRRRGAGGVSAPIGALVGAAYDPSPGVLPRRERLRCSSGIGARSRRRRPAIEVGLIALGRRRRGPLDARRHLDERAAALVLRLAPARPPAEAAPTRGDQRASTITRTSSVRRRARAGRPRAREIALRTRAACPAGSLRNRSTSVALSSISARDGRLAASRCYSGACCLRHREIQVDDPEGQSDVARRRESPPRRKIAANAVAVREIRRPTPAGTRRRRECFEISRPTRGSTCRKYQR